MIILLFKNVTKNVIITRIFQFKQNKISQNSLILHFSLKINIKYSKILQMTNKLKYSFPK